MKDPATMLAPNEMSSWERLPETLYRPGVPASRADIAFLALGVEEAAVVRRIHGPEPTIRVGPMVPGDLYDAIAGHPEQRLLVIGLADRLTVARVEALLAGAADIAARIGFVSGRTADAIAHSLLKLAARPRNDLVPLETFDAAGHSLDHGSADAAALRKRLLGPARVKILRCHGEGSHAKFAGLTVCGLLDDREFEPHPDLGCSQVAQRCKRAPPIENGQVVFGKDIAAHLVFFLCCNGFNLARELYPSPVSITLSLIEGQAMAVVAPTRPVIVPDALFYGLISRVEAGGRLGDIVEALNAAYRQLDGCAPFVVHGDPGLEIVVGPERRGNAPRPAGLRLSRLDATVAGAVGDIQRRLVQLRTNAGRCGRMLDAMGAAAPGVDLASVEAALANLRRLTIHALKRCETVLDADQLRQARRDEGLIHTLVQRLDLQLARLVVSARQYVDPFDLFHYDQVRERAVDGPACERCGTVTRILCFGASESSSEQREGLDCPVCGPKTERRRAGLALAVTHRFDPPTLELGFAARSAEIEIVPYAALALRFFDKARDRCVVSLDEMIQLGAPHVAHAAILPADLSPDLHSVRIVAVSGLDFAYSRLRVPGGSSLWDAARGQSVP